MAETRVVITAEAEQAIAEFERLRQEASGSLEQVGEGSEQLNQVGNSANQTAQALRQVPAQFTDIIVSLQGGMNPLTVFLQQGGQLRDMFGSSGAAASALRDYVIGLVTPMMAAAAVAALLATAYQQGSKEADEYAKAIALTGNAAGVTTQQLGNMAKVAADTAGTQGANAAALAALVGTGRVGAEQLVNASITAVQAQKYLGIAVDQTVDAFASLGEDPLQATLKLNDQYGYLTLATYQQIKALEQEGRMSEAATVAQNAYADAMKEKSGQVAASLGNLQKSWNAVSGAAKSAWDFMLDIGREETIDDKLKRAEERLKRAKLAFFNFIGSDADKTREKEEAERERDRLLNIRKAGELTAQFAAEDKKAREAAIKFDDEGEQYLSRRARMEEEITRTRNLGQQAAARGEDPAATEQRIQERIAQIRLSYSDLNNAAIESQIANVERLGAVQEEAAQRARILLDTGKEAGFSQAADQRVAYAEKVAKLDEESLVREKASFKQRIALVASEMVSEDDRAEQQEKLAEMRGRIAVVDEQILTRRAELTKELTVMDAAANRAAFNMLDKLLSSREADVVALRSQVRAQQDENAVLGLNTRQAQIFNTELVNERATRMELEAGILDTIVGREAEADAMRESARLLRELNAEQIAGANKKVAIDANKSFWDSVDHTAQNAFSNIFEGGKSVSDRLRDAFKSGLLDVLYQLTIKRWIINVSTSMSGSDVGSSIGAALSGTSTGGGSGALGTAMNLFSAGKMIYSGFSAGVASSLGGSIASLGNLFGSQAVSAFGTGMTLTGAQAATAAGAYTAAGNTAAAGGLTAGAGAASAIPIIGWIIAGMSAANGFAKQGFSANNGTLNGLGSAVALPTNFIEKSLGWLGMNKTLSNILSGASINTKLFGRADPRVESQGVRGTINANGITAENYANILAKGGVFRSDKRWTETAALNVDTDTSFDTTIKGMISAVKGFGKAMGIEASMIDGYSKAFDIKLTGDEAKDNEAVAKLFADVGDELSVRLLPSLSKFSNEGETLSATLQRLSIDYVSVDNGLTAIGQSIKLVGASGIEAREQLIAAAGGLDALNTGATFFQQNFLSEAEQMAPVQKQLAEAMTAMGYASVQTTDQFKTAALSIDLSTKEGAERFAQLLALAPAFKAVADYTAELAGTVTRSASAIRDEGRSLQSQLDELTMSQIQLADKALAAIDPSNRALYDQLQAAKASVSAKEALAAAYERESTAAKAAIQGTKDWVATLLGMNDSLALGSQSILTPEQQYAEARAQFEKALAAANDGDATARSNLAAAEQAFLAASQVVNGADARYAADYARVIAANEQAAKWAQVQVDMQQASLDKLEAVVQGVIDINESLLTVGQALANVREANIAADGLGVKFAPVSTVTPAAPAVAPAPVIDFSRYAAASNVGSDALAAEIRSLNARLDAQTEEIKGLRADQAKQTGAMIQSNERANAKAADKVVDGVQKSATASAWSSTVKGEYA